MGRDRDRDDWKGLGQDDGGSENVGGFAFTTDGGNDDGTFTFSTPLTSNYNQFAVGIKDGGSPKWAIFMLPVDTLTGNLALRDEWRRLVALRAVWAQLP